MDGADKTDFHQLAALIRRCDIVVGNDSGIMHFASSLNVPVVALFGPTDYRKTRPVGKHITIIRKEMKCSPCYKKGRIKRSCKNIDCFAGITPVEVFDAADALLGEIGKNIRKKD